MSDLIKILFCGDFVSGNTKNLTVSSYIKNLIRTSDINCCNFEAPVKNNGIPIDKSGSILCQSRNAPKFLEELGFNLVQLANNHIFDYGRTGYEETIGMFKTAILAGAGKYADAYQVKTFRIKKKNIGFLALTHFEFGTLGIDATIEEIGTAWINHYYVNKLIIEARKSLDYLFILPHAGVEMIEVPIPEWRTRYKEFIDLGADGVISTHPHIPQGWETYKGKPIFYSLGNFYFDTVKNDNFFWNKGLIVEIEISSGINFFINNIVFDEEKIVEDNSQSRLLHNKRLCGLLEGEKYIEYINNIALIQWDIYLLNLKGSLNTISFSKNLKKMIRSLINTLFKKPDHTVLVNLLRCESHRWFMIRALELIINNKSQK